MSFGREFSKYLPGTADILSEGIRRRAQAGRVEKLAGPLAGTPEDAAAAVRTPEFQKLGAQAGMSTEDFLSLYKQLPAEQQRQASELINKLEVDYIDGKPLKPHEMEILYGAGKLDRPKEPNPLEARTKSFFAENPGLMDEAIKRQYNIGPKPDTRSELEKAQDEQLQRDPNDRKRAARIGLKLEPGAATEKPDITTGQTLNEVQQAVAAQLAALKNRQYTTITPDQYKKIQDPSERETYRYGYSQKAGEYYYLEHPEITKKVMALEDYLGNLGAQLKSADSTIAARQVAPAGAPPVPPGPPGPAGGAEIGPQPPTYVTGAQGDPGKVFEEVVLKRITPLTEAGRDQEALDMVEAFVAELSDDAAKQQFAEMWGIPVEAVDEMVAQMQSWLAPADTGAGE